MAEAISAVGVAANVVQLLDVGARFVGSVRAFYVSARDGVGELPDLETITNDFEAILKSLNKPDNTGSSSKNEHNLQAIVLRSQELTKDLLNILRPLNSPSRSRRRDALRQALRELRKNEIGNLEARLEKLRQELMFHLLALIRHQGQQELDRQTQFIVQLDDFRKGQTNIEQKLSMIIANQEGIGKAMVQALCSDLEPASQSRNYFALSKSLISSVQTGTEDQSASSGRTIQMSGERIKALQEYFLTTLSFPEINDRERSISEAHEKTFHWIFEDLQPRDTPRPSFRLWLESDAKLYWITGKPGSGKSTLMKYIRRSTKVRHLNRDPETVEPSLDPTEPQCVVHLRKWAGPDPLTIAAFYLWNAGTARQMSRQGLVRSILKQILTQHPDLIPVVSPKIWESLSLFDDFQGNWTEHELVAMFRAAIRATSKTAKVCLFIDGLDECSGNHKDIITLIHDLVSIPNVKICVSSRPLNEFHDAFEHVPSFAIHDFTLADVKEYIIERFLADKNFDQLHQRNKAYAEDLVHIVATKANGVFLWVNLVVTSLLEGMQHGDGIKDLQRRLDTLPPDLENLYEEILSSLDPFYREHAARYFKLVEQSLQRLCVATFLFCDDYDISAAIERPLRALTPDETCSIKDTTQRRIRSRCKGLLEVHMNAWNDDIHVAPVTFLHRSAKEFLMSQTARQILDCSPTTAEAAAKSLSAGTFACLKTLFPLAFDSSLNNEHYISLIRQHGEHFLSQTALISQTDSVLVNAVMENFSTFSAQFLSFCEGYMSRMPDHYGPLTTEVLRGLVRNNELATSALALTYGMTVCFRHDGLSMTQTTINQLLYLAVLRIEEQAKATKQVGLGQEIKILELLLLRKADPNGILHIAPTRKKDASIWINVVDLLLSPDVHFTLTREWTDALRLFVEYGARDEQADTTKSLTSRLSRFKIAKAPRLHELARHSRMETAEDAKLAQIRRLRQQVKRDDNGSKYRYFPIRRMQAVPFS